MPGARFPGRVASGAPRGLRLRLKLPRGFSRPSLPRVDETPRLYGDLAAWWPLLSPPEEYAEEASIYREILLHSAASDVERVLELGSGGGNNASYLKTQFFMTLVDRSEPMLEVSRALNPECAHFQGDMRTVRLGEVFDAVFLHDALSYLTDIEDVIATARTAREHCSPSGVALFVPDYVSETFEPGTEHGGSDEGPRGLRYLQWVWDSDPSDTMFEADMVYLLRDGDEVSVVHDRHPQGLFPTAMWLGALSTAGFDAEFQTRELSDGSMLNMFIGTPSNKGG
jgi:SAM-dependent methyltransferase